jgi:hypothetical protein
VRRRTPSCPDLMALADTPPGGTQGEAGGGTRCGRCRAECYFLLQSAKILSLARIASVTLVNVGLQAVEVGMIPLPPK